MMGPKRTGSFRLLRRESRALFHRLVYSAKKHVGAPFQQRKNPGGEQEQSLDRTKETYEGELFVSRQCACTRVSISRREIRWQRKVLRLSLNRMNYQHIITIEPGKRGGKPCVRGMRITVSDILGWLAAGMSHQEILEDYPELTEEDIRACLAYAADRERKAMTVVRSHEAPA